MTARRSVASGACVGRDPEWWFADEGSEEDQAAASLCGLCPVSVSCFNGAVQRGERHGRWGGERFPLPALELVESPQLETWHGEPAGYKAHGCRCGPCRVAHAADVKAWRDRMTGAPRMAATSANKLERCSQIPLFELA